MYGKTRKEVADKLAAMQADLQKGIRPSSDKLTLKSYLTDWMEGATVQKLRSRSRERYQQIIELHINSALGKVVLSRLTPPQIEKFLTAKLAAGLAPATVETIFAVLKKALSDAERHDLIARNPARRVSLPCDEEDAEGKRGKPLDPEEAGLFRQAIRGDRLEACYLLAATCGLRMGEILGLSWGALNLEGTSPTLDVKVQLQRDPSQEGRLTLSVPKTKGSRRALILPRFVVDVLRAHRAAMLRERLLISAWKERNPHDLVFVTTNGRPIRAANLLKGFKRLLSRHGLEERRFHDLRHSTASLLHAEGFDIKTIQEILGHADMRITADTYTQMFMETRQEVADAMDRFFGT